IPGYPIPGGIYFPFGKKPSGSPAPLCGSISFTSACFTPGAYSGESSLTRFPCVKPLGLFLLPICLPGAPALCCDPPAFLRSILLLCMPSPYGGSGGGPRATSPHVLRHERRQWPTCDDGDVHHDASDEPWPTTSPLPELPHNVIPVSCRPS